MTTAFGEPEPDAEFVRSGEASLRHLDDYTRLRDGTTGVVVATHMSRRDRNTPSRPVVMLLTDENGQKLPAPRYLDLNECEGRSILRSRPGAEQTEASLPC